VDHGVVMLTGQAKSMSEHGRALRTARRVPGVKSVTSRIESPDTLAETEIWRDGSYDAAVYDRSSARDGWITTAVKVRLLASPETPGMAINVDTEDGVVTLFGGVDSEHAKEAASVETRKVDGVRQVRNALQIVPASKQEVVQAQDADVQRAIEARIKERRDLGTSSVTVEVKKGIARLTGTVESPSDRLVVLTVARSTAGVRGLIDDLRLETPAISSR
jgi:osmotically-inducible protein OsmY